MSTALKIPVASPTAISARPPGSNAHPDVSSVIVYEATTTQNVISAATETSKPPTSSAQVWPSETRASGIVSEEQVPEVEAREEGVLADGRERADRDDQGRHQHERQHAAEPADPHADSSAARGRLRSRTGP